MSIDVMMIIFVISLILSAIYWIADTPKTICDAMEKDWIDVLHRMDQMREEMINAKR